jgi:hypothetical protein
VVEPRYINVDPRIESIECIRRRGERLHLPADRYLIREDYVEAEGTYIGAVSYGYICKEWAFHYSDGTTETVTTRTPK